MKINNGCLIQVGANEIVNGVFNTPHGITSIGDHAFQGCLKLKSINLPASLTSIGDDAFWGCQSLESINLPEGLQSIGSRAFWGCQSLESISLPASLTSIGDGVFGSCRSLESISLPEGLQSIGARAFWSCEKLECISLPASLTSIGDNAFWGCRSLESINLPASLASIGDNSFGGCNSCLDFIIEASALEEFERIKAIFPQNIHDHVRDINSEINHHMEYLVTLAKTPSDGSASEHDDAWAKEVTSLINEHQQLINTLSSTGSIRKERQKEFDSFMVTLYAKQAQLDDAIAYYQDHSEITSSATFELVSAVLASQHRPPKQRYQIIVQLLKNNHPNEDLQRLLQQSALGLLSKDGDATPEDSLTAYNLYRSLSCSELIAIIDKQKSLDDALEVLFKSKAPLMTRQEMAAILSNTPFKEIVQQGELNIATYESLILATENNSGELLNKVELQQINPGEHERRYQQIISEAVKALTGNQAAQPAAHHGLFASLGSRQHNTTTPRSDTNKTPK